MSINSKYKAETGNLSILEFDYLESPVSSSSILNHEVHVWLASSIGQIDLDPIALAGRLPEDEVNRASRFRFAGDCRRWVESRLILRDILSRYVGLPARSIEISAIDLEKPQLVDFPEIDFNLSHSGDAVMVSIARNRKVGVDIEEINPTRADRSVAHAVYSAAELKWLSLLEGDEWVNAFFRAWVRKEAVVKASGMGLSAALTSVTATTEQDNGCPYSFAGISIFDLYAPSGYKAALAVSTLPEN